MPDITKAELHNHKGSRGVVIAGKDLTRPESEVELAFEPLLTKGGQEEYFAQMNKWAREEVVESNDYGFVIAVVEDLTKMLDDPNVSVQAIFSEATVWAPDAAENNVVKDDFFTRMLDGPVSNWVEADKPKPKPKPKTTSTKVKVKAKKKSKAAQALIEDDKRDDADDVQADPKEALKKRLKEADAKKKAALADETTD